LFQKKKNIFTTKTGGFMTYKVAIISDIHANYEALTAVIDDMEKAGAVSAISLGDNIGYGPDPNKVIILLKLNSIRSVTGNHEAAILDDQLLLFFNTTARESILKTRSILSPNTVQQIKSYPNMMIKYGCRFIHGAPPDEIHTYLFEISKDGFTERFKRYKEQICFTGHTHRFGIISYDKGNISQKHFSNETEISLDNDKRYIINCGSVGQPRESDKRAGYIIFDTENLNITIRKIQYNRNETRKKILNNGFPAVYAGML